MADFTPDGCTSFPDGWWRVCCSLHDAFYWFQPDGITKEIADQAMTSCVTYYGMPLASLVMAVGVGFGGWKYWRRGRRGDLKDMPKILTTWLALKDKLPLKPKLWRKLDDKDLYPPDRPNP